MTKEQIQIQEKLIKKYRDLNQLSKGLKDIVIINLCLTNEINRVEEL